ncbi:hypothetical protein [Dysgonomonas termitidis]|uniref:Uncharacterized protein n=1 Tax=Dysgonomonas termitidis TaxID=1516126 RepID=A0ABV9L0Y9_9BACT
MSKITIVIFRLKGLMSLSQKVTLDNGKGVRIEYTGGSNNGTSIIGGRYMSKDPLVIKAIKASQRFKDKQIYVESETEEDAPDEEGTESLSQKVTLDNGKGVGVPQNPDLYSEHVSNQQQVREFMGSKGVSPEILNNALTAESLVILAKENGFNFPNWRIFNE